MREQDNQGSGDRVSISFGERGVIIFYLLFWSVHAVMSLNPNMAYMTTTKLREWLLSNSELTKIIGASFIYYLIFLFIPICLTAPVVIYLTRLLIIKSIKVSTYILLISNNAVMVFVAFVVIDYYLFSV